LPRAFKNKIDRYVACWQQESGGTWPQFPKLSVGKHTQPSLIERAGDEILFRILRAFDRFTSLVYCLAPISLLRRYRAAKAKPAPEAKIIAPKSSAITEVSPPA
jgi:hypothetical protein